MEKQRGRSVKEDAGKPVRGQANPTAAMYCPLFQLQYPSSTLILSELLLLLTEPFLSRLFKLISVRKIFFSSFQDRRQGRIVLTNIGFTLLDCGGCDDCEHSEMND